MRFEVGPSRHSPTRCLGWGSLVDAGSGGNQKFSDCSSQALLRQLRQTD